MDKQVWVVTHLCKFSNNDDYCHFTDSVCATKELAIKDAQRLMARAAEPNGDDWVYEEHDSHGVVFGWQNKKSRFIYEGVFASLVDFIY
jgi:hypothetical protein